MKYESRYFFFWTQIWIEEAQKLNGFVSNYIEIYNRPIIFNNYLKQKI